MKIRSIHLQNFRCFRDETISLNRYSCFVGPNGCGKSSVLAALNVFFREQASSATDINKLTDEDYCGKNIKDPIRITVVFDDVSQKALTELAPYVQDGQLTITAEAAFDSHVCYGQVKHYGQHIGMAEFCGFFNAERNGAKASDLTEIFDELRQQHADLPNARTKDEKIQALRAYEADHADKCTVLPYEDNFCGANGTGKLASFVQWVYVPAVKDAGEEGQESKNTALAKLIARAVRTRTNFDADLELLRTQTLTKYQKLLKQNQASLAQVSQALQRRLESWAHPGAQLGMEWISDPSRAVLLQPPIAGIKTGEGDFLGSLNRMGHGLQRCYLLALLQELAGSDAPNAPTLILGCEEPELYQHPPQARHLADAFAELSAGNNQILVTTHSPLFVSGDGFENVRLVRRAGTETGTVVRSLTFQALCTRIREARGEDPQRRVEGLVATIHQALRPGISEMFFTRVPVLVEGLEDVSYITTQLHLSKLWPEFRQLGCHLIPVNGKDKLIRPLAIAIELEIPVFVVFDADGDTKGKDHRPKHEHDNQALIALLGARCRPFPASNVWGRNHAVWKTNLTQTVKDDFRNDYARLTDAARNHYAQEGGLEKNDLFIAEWVSAAHGENLESPTLKKLTEAIIRFARKGALV